MRVRELLSPDRTLFDIEGSSKKRLFDQAATLIAGSCPEMAEQDIFDALIARERLGSTGIGEGIAIPHCRMASCEKPVGLLISLRRPIDFESVDARPVDLVFFLLVPEQNPEQHLKTLSHLAALFNEPAFRNALRNSTSADNLYHQAVDSETELQFAS